MKKSVLALILTIFVLCLTSCSSSNLNSSIAQTRLDFLLTLENGNYDEFNERLAIKKGILTKEEFLAIKRNTTDSSHVREIQVFEFDNGEIILLEFIKDEASNTYKIQDIITVPDDAKDIFKSKDQ